jgi:hypothetical protein
VADLRVTAGLHGACSKDVWLYTSGQVVVEPIHVRFREIEGMRESGESERERERAREGEM